MQAASSGNEVDDTIRELKKITGFTSYLILNNDGKIIKFYRILLLKSNFSCGFIRDCN